METIVEKQIEPSKIMQIGMGFWASKTLLTGVNLGLLSANFLRVFLKKLIIISNFFNIGKLAIALRYLIDILSFFSRLKERIIFENYFILRSLTP